MKKYSLFLFGFIFACGGSQTSEQTATVRDVKDSQDVVSGKANTLAIDAGSASGAEATLPDGALAEGSQVSLDRSQSVPGAFSETNLASVSQPLVVSASKDGVAVEQLSKPMTLKIPKGASGLRLGGEIDPTDDNLCVFLTNSLGFFVWRSSELSISSSVVTISSNYLGTFQLYYCGKEDVSGSEEAAEVESLGTSKSITVNIPATYQYAADHYCLAFLSHDSEGSTSLMSGRNAAIAVSGQVTSAVFSVSQSKFKSDLSYSIGIFYQDSVQTCDETTELDLQFNRGITFARSNSDMEDASYVWTLGSDFMATESITVELGSSTSATLATQDSTSRDMCVHSDEDDGTAAMNTSVGLSAALSATGTATASFDVPKRTLHDISMKIGDRCDGSSSSFQKFSYSGVTGGSTVHLLPFAFRFLAAPVQFDALAGMSVCLKVYDSSNQIILEQTPIFDRTTLFETYIPESTSYGYELFPKEDCTDEIPFSKHSGSFSYSPTVSL